MAEQGQNPRGDEIGPTHRVVRRGATTPSLGRVAAGIDWRSDAACADKDTDLFFPVGTTGPAVSQAEDAKKVCMGCDVREQCLEFALASNQDAGIWGGLTEDERRTLRRSRQRRRRMS